ncbi:putative PIN family toxin of toxin-antitoxin system [Scopulibacillus darangshiensis]|uniref:Putative PIN family toxin of toxin-antitoxin system n=1 Tax=Scopulibacillus darangshiensis TaxID=442528 RepID=A0A4R2P672_9BACL|nr:putative toxin-antitoxin system toxin component, PIN family [Scopulibacillus darangshiensis]TCP30217.1 putative PIN family toxin of toxin-antitoxin system [Scopulibacillus darangshiensis]
MVSKPKVVVDTNVFIDGLIAGKDSSQQIMDLFNNVKITLLFSQDTIGELAYVAKIISRKAIRDIDKRIEFLSLIMYIFYHSKSVNTIDQDNRLEVRCKDPRDDMFLDCAYYGKADYLISDDKKSGLHSVFIDGVTILTSDDFIKLYNE